MNGIDYLQKLGLTQYESKALIPLFRQEFTAKEISKLSDVPITRTYDSLESAKSKGIPVKYTDSVPRVYKRLRAEKVLIRLLNKKLEDLNRLSKDRDSQSFEVVINQCNSGKHQLKRKEHCFC